ncbi:MAG TPA: ribosome-associated translation inhibitor RaiA [Candidatus Saccharimonadia bacterium]
MKIEITSRNFELDEKIRAYTNEKIGSLEKYAAHRKDTVHAAVVLEEDVSGREDNRYVCDVVLAVPGTRLVAREGTVNMYAAVDIVEAKLRGQLVKHKEKRADGPRRGRFLSRWLGRSAGEPVTESGEIEL